MISRICVYLCSIVLLSFPIDQGGGGFVRWARSSPQDKGANHQNQPGTTVKSTSKTQAKTAQKEEILSNDSILQLLKAGFDEDLVIAKIKSSKCNFDLSIQGMLALKQGGVSDRLMHFMMDPTKPVEPKKETSPIVTPPADQPAAKPVADPPPPSGGVIAAILPPDPARPAEIGVYIKKDNQWLEIQPEVVNWKTGGVIKHVASVGIVKGDVNGRINGAHSRNTVKSPFEFLIITAEGIAITEYQFLHLREQKDAREFRTVTGGVFHASGGATRDLLQFEGTKVASRTFSVVLPNLGSGEYGFLPPGAVASTHAAATLGKMYTFRVD